VRLLFKPRPPRFGGGGEEGGGPTGGRGLQPPFLPCLRGESKKRIKKKQLIGKGKKKITLDRGALKRPKEDLRRTGQRTREWRGEILYGGRLLTSPRIYCNRPWALKDANPNTPKGVRLSGGGTEEGNFFRVYR